MTDEEKAALLRKIQELEAQLRTAYSVVAFMAPSRYGGR